MNVCKVVFQFTSWTLLYISPVFAKLMLRVQAIKRCEKQKMSKSDSYIIYLFY